MSAMEGAASEAEAEEEAEEEEEEEEVVAVAEGAAPAPLEEECLRFMVEGVYVGLRRGGVADGCGSSQRAFDGEGRVGCVDVPMDCFNEDVYVKSCKISNSQNESFKCRLV